VRTVAAYDGEVAQPRLDSNEGTSGGSPMMMRAPTRGDLSEAPVIVCEAHAALYRRDGDGRR
jgi:hypothetical protein